MCKITHLQGDRFVLSSLMIYVFFFHYIKKYVKIYILFFVDYNIMISVFLYEYASMQVLFEIMKA